MKNSWLVPLSKSGCLEPIWGVVNFIFASVENCLQGACYIFLCGYSTGIGEHRKGRGLVIWGTLKSLRS